MTDRPPLCSDILGAGMLPYAMSPRGELYFLLGKEAPNPRWGRPEEKWCDFIGTTKPSESDVDTASREGIEETAAVVRMSDSDTSQWSPQEVLRSALLGGDYAHRISTAAKPGDTRQRVCYLKQVPWQPDAPVRFRSVTQKLRALADIEDAALRRQTYERLSPSMKLHPAFRVSLEGDLIVAKEYLEKTRLRWFSVPQLFAVLQRAGTYDPKFPFRIGFTPTLTMALHLVLSPSSLASFYPQHPVFSVQFCTNPAKTNSPETSPEGKIRED